MAKNHLRNNETRAEKRQCYCYLKYIEGYEDRPGRQGIEGGGFVTGTELTGTIISICFKFESIPHVTAH